MITPLVTSIVVLIIGLSLIKEGLVSMGGGYGTRQFSSPQNLLLSTTVLLLIIVFNRLSVLWVRSSAAMLAPSLLVVGYRVAVGAWVT
ncbi:MAG: Uracil-xanthine permease [Candidatus Tokpelaia sp. JSC189]|nr:MAG: Uracil-xanthine permease [Candidatus Tokpelaia sp. JSC189]